MFLGLHVQNRKNSLQNVGPLSFFIIYYTFICVCVFLFILSIAYHLW